jgi:hypothetical protein
MPRSRKVPTSVPTTAVDDVRPQDGRFRKRFPHILLADPRARTSAPLWASRSTIAAPTNPEPPNTVMRYGAIFGFPLAGDALFHAREKLKFIPSQQD